MSVTGAGVSTGGGVSTGVSGLRAVGAAD